MPRRQGVGGRGVRSTAATCARPPSANQRRKRASSPVLTLTRSAGAR
ncbi:hypothetical protein [Rubritalea tangerina]